MSENDRSSKNEHDKQNRPGKLMPEKQGFSMPPPPLDIDAGDGFGGDPAQLKTGESRGGENSPEAPNDLLGQMGNAMGADFSGVNIHANSSKANDLGALAFAQGNDVHFAPGQFQPGTSEGNALIGHELAHVVQQREGRVSPTGKENGHSVNTDKALEAEADQKGAQAAAQLKSANVTTTSTVGSYSGPIQKAPDPNAPQLEHYKGEDVNQQGRISASAATYQDAVATGMNIRAIPEPGARAIAKLTYNSEVMVKASNHSGGWYFVIANDGTAGWINQAFVALNPPDPGAKLHHVTETDLTTILKQQYVDTGQFTLETGNDYTSLTAAVLSANQGRGGVYASTKKREAYQDDNKLRTALDPMSDNFADYASAEVVKGANIWLPSASYIQVLKDAGVVATRPDWMNTAMDVGDTVIGLQAGIYSGVFGAIWDTLSGLYNIGKQIVTMVRDAFTGELFAQIGAIYNEVKAKFDELAAMSKEQLTAYAGELLSQFSTSIGGAVDGFVNQWTHPDTYKRWFFRGKIVGQVLLEVVLAIFTAGAGNAVKWAGFIGKFSPKLAAIISKGIAKADKLIPDGMGRKKKTNSSKDRLNDNGSQMEGGAPAAFLYAQQITEMHDQMNSPIPVLHASLQGIQKTFKGVQGYKINPKIGQPGHFQVIQMAKVVDEDYNIQDKEELEYERGAGHWTKEEFDSLKEYVFNHGFSEKDKHTFANLWIKKNWLSLDQMKKVVESVAHASKNHDIEFKEGWDFMTAYRTGLDKYFDGEVLAPTEYLDPKYIERHLGQFEGKGSYLVPGDVYEIYIRPKDKTMLGFPDGQFLSSPDQIDEILAKANGDISVVESELGIPSGLWEGREGLIRVDVLSPKDLNLRLPTGNEMGANEFWIPGGYTSGNAPEAFVDKIPKTSTKIERVIQ